MPLNRITCPECGAGLKSASGFTPGETVSCPKCETEFGVEEPEEEPKKAKPGGRRPAEVASDEDDDRPRKKKKKRDEDDDSDGEEWSYKNSWIRYTILAVLVVVMLVLAYMLYEKKQREANAGRSGPPASAGGA